MATGVWCCKQSLCGAGQCRTLSCVALVVLVLGGLPSAAAARGLAGLGDLLPPFITNGFDGLVNTAAQYCETLPLQILFSRECSARLPQLTVVEFTGASRRPRGYPGALAPQRLRRFRPLPALLVYIPGWWNTPTDEASLTVAAALLLNHPVVLVLDTRPAFSGTYMLSASRVKPLARLLVNVLKNLYAEGVPLESVHLIGFSLGAHVAGITGKMVHSEMGKKLGRITALDPARPCFSKPSKFRLDKDDAHFVQVVHTSAGGLGLERPLGHADVYVNGVSRPQPECATAKVPLECDHAQAWKLFSASVADEHFMMGKRCRSWNELKSARCSGNETMVGYGSSMATRGMFLYETHQSAQKTEPQLKVFNPLDLLTWWLE